MNKLESILVVMDPALQRSPALERAAELARRARARLRLCLFDFDPLIERTADLVSPEVMHLARAQFERQRQQQLAQQAAALVAEGLQVDCEVIWCQFLYEGVVARCLQQPPDLVIKDLRRGGRGMSAADRHLMRYCPAPLWLVGAATLPKRILAAVDTASEAMSASALNDGVVRGTQAAALYAGAEMHVAHVFPLQRRGMVTSPHLRRLHAQLRAGDLRRFSDFCAARQIGAERRHYLEGDPALKLAALARRIQAGLIVLGTTYKTGFDRLLLGSTSEALASRVPPDVMLLRPDSFVDDLSRHLDLAALERHFPRAESA